VLHGSGQRQADSSFQLLVLQSTPLQPIVDVPSDAWYRAPPGTPRSDPHRTLQTIYGLVPAMTSLGSGCARRSGFAPDGQGCAHCASEACCAIALCCATIAGRSTVSSSCAPSNSARRSRLHPPPRGWEHQRDSVIADRNARYAQSKPWVRKPTKSAAIPRHQTVVMSSRPSTSAPPLWPAAVLFQEAQLSPSGRR
jgi:hypothetical protein